MLFYDTLQIVKTLINAKVREDAVNRQAGLGRIGRSVIAFVSVGLAADTERSSRRCRQNFGNGNFLSPLGAGHSREHLGLK